MYKFYTPLPHSILHYFVAEIVTAPRPTPLANPVLSTVATAGLLLPQVAMAVMFMSLGGISEYLPVAVNWTVCPCVGVGESVTCTVKLKVPKEVGSPDINPLLLFNVTPAGRAPEIIVQL